MGSYVTILSWMRGLGLKGNELLAFAIVYSFSRDGVSSYQGSAAYVAEWIGCTTKTARTILNKLADQGYILKVERWENNVKYCDYRVGKNLPQGREKISLGVGKKFPQGREKISPHNNRDNEDINISSNNNISSEVEFDFYAALISLPITGQTAKDWLAVRKAKRAVNTQTAFEELKSEIEKSGQTPEQCIRTAILRNWCGFKASWLADDKSKAPEVPEAEKEHDREQLEWLKQRRGEQEKRKEEYLKKFGTL